jgi:hypothetical protein
MCKMETGRWEEPVTFESGKLAQFRTISITAEAAHVLTSQWPCSGGEACVKAREACPAALEDRGRASAARKAFVKAAAGASVFVKS